MSGQSTLAPSSLITGSGQLGPAALRPMRACGLT